MTSATTRFPQGPVVDENRYVTLEWSEWLQNPQVLTISYSSPLGVSSGGTGLASGSSGQILVFTAATTLANLAMSGDATLAATGALTIGANKVSNAKLAQMAANTIKGNNTAGTADPSDLTVTQAQTLLAIPAEATGTWTPADGSGAGLAFSGVSAAYTKHGNMVFAYGTLTYPATADGTASKISGLPFTVANQNYAQVPAVVATTTAFANGLVVTPVKNTTTATFGLASAVAARTNAQLTGATVTFCLAYPVA